jgi:6,7-dimethyl-8-ribityllumazine synthase
MPRVIEGTLTAPAGRFAVVAAKFNREVVDKLVEGALSAFRQHSVRDEAIDLVCVPGSFEIPLTAKQLAQTGKYVAVVCLGAVILGETDHYQHVCEQAAAGILRAGLDTGVPVIFGVLTCRTEEQALDRAGGKEGNKGFDAAVAAIEMANLLGTLNP